MLATIALVGVAAPVRAGADDAPDVAPRAAEMLCGEPAENTPEEAAAEADAVILVTVLGRRHERAKGPEDAPPVRVRLHVDGVYRGAGSRAGQTRVVRLVDPRCLGGLQLLPVGRQLLIAL